MASVSQPGSRAGLITALVISVIGFLVCLVLVFIRHSDLKRAEKALADTTKKYEVVVQQKEMADSRYRALSDLKSSVRDYAERSLLDILFVQRDELAKKLTGQVHVNAAEAVALVDKRLEEVSAKLPADAKLTRGPVVDLIAFLAGKIVERDQALAKAAADLKAAGDALAAEKATHTQAVAEVQKAVAAAQAETAAKAAELDAYQKAQEERIKAMEARQTQQLDEVNNLLASQKKEAEGKDTEIAKLLKDLRTARLALQRLRPSAEELAKPILHRPDGRIIQVSRNNTVFIDLGQGQQIYPGMTFAVYDRIEGVPKSGDAAEDALPKGKGSIEVITVSPGSSECRVVHTEPGQQIGDGDLVANLAYDQNVKMRFHLYGEFDIDGNNQATVAERDNLRRQVQLFGGAVTDKLDVDTDVLVMGKEPVVPEKPGDDPVSKFEYEQALKKLQEYEAVRDRALELGIPVMNQNRFLYYTGYYHMARR